MIQEKLNPRLEANRIILDTLIAAVEKYPDHRFGQILRNLEIVQEIRNADGMPVAWKNTFDEESVETLKRVTKYTEILENLGVYIKNNTRMALRRLGLDKLRRQGKLDEI